MRLLLAMTSIVVLSTTSPPLSQLRETPPGERGQRLEDLTWLEAERALAADTIVVIPLGAASVEHGPHLKLNTDRTLAEYLSARVADRSRVIVAPTLSYHHYPAFLEYPGSISLPLEQARDMTVEVARSLARFGPRRFYVLNTSITASPALEVAAAALATDGVLLRHTPIATRLEAAAKGVSGQAAGLHADEIETSMMLFVEPASVEMSKAVKQDGPASGTLNLTRTPDGKGFFSPSGVHGDPTLATRDKGRTVIDALVAGLLDDIAALRAAQLPNPQTARSSSQTALPSHTPPLPSAKPERCSPGDERAIRGLGFAFSAHWTNANAIGLGGMWSSNGDIIHTDGTVERGRDIITQNRMLLFGRPEYRNSRHSVILNMINCISADIAVADGTWDLRGVVDREGKPVPRMEGQVTLVVRRTGDWYIDAYRYTVKPPGENQSGTPGRPSTPGTIIR